LSGEAFLNWMNSIAAATAVVLIVSACIFGPTAPITRLSVLMLLAVGLGALFVGLEPLRESVMRRVLSFHVLLALPAAVTVGGSSALIATGRGRGAAWGCVLVLLTAGAIGLPRRVDRAIARSLFPRADAMLARLASVAAAPLSEGTRAEAGASLLRQVVD